MTTVAHEELCNLPQGWFHHGEKVLDLVEQYRPRVIVELGTWRGASAIALARMVRRWEGEVFCVDTWMGEVNGGIAPGPMPVMLLECAGNVIRAGVAGSIRFIPALTLDAARWWTRPIDFLYVDADHTYESVTRDLEAWVPHVKRGGLFAGDDYGNSLYPGVKRAWDDFEKRHNLTLERFATPNTEPRGMELIYGVRNLA